MVAASSKPEKRRGRALRRARFFQGGGPLIPFQSKTAEYALRATAGIALRPPGSPVRAVDLSREIGIPSHYLSKILRRLVLAGILESRKGLGGGFTLAKGADEILFVDVLVAVDAYPSDQHCAFGWDTCDGAHPCPLHQPWSQMTDAFRAWASSTTFAQVVQTPAHLDRLEK